MFYLELQSGFLLQVLYLNVSKHTIDIMSRMISYAATKKPATRLEALLLTMAEAPRYGTPSAKQRIGQMDDWDAIHITGLLEDIALLKDYRTKVYRFSISGYAVNSFLHVKLLYRLYKSILKGYALYLRWTE